MLTARKLCQKFGPITALDSVSFDIAAGEFVFLTGPSGSGKTTLFRLILRELMPGVGQLLFENHDLAKMSSKDLLVHRRDLGPVFQDFKLLADRNVWENVALPLQVRYFSPSEIAKAVKLALEMVDLSSRTQLFPAQLSGGEIQRVAIARAVVGQPKLLLADEPTGNLDPKTARSIANLLQDIHRQLKTTVIMATHNADIVNRFPQRVISLNRGQVIKDVPKGKYE